MKILYVTTISNTVNAFLIPHIKMLIEEGHEVDVAFNIAQKVKDELLELDIKIHEIPFSRSPLSKENVRAYRELKSLVIKKKYDIVHTHTPVASAIVRLACKNIISTRVFYTAHGFHFHKGAPLLNWLTYYPIEKALSRYTDTLITINAEDYKIAEKFFRNNPIRLFKMSGMGIDKVANYSRKTESKDKYYKLFYAAELNENKNQILLLKVMKKINAIDDINVKLYLAGEGLLEKKLKNYITDNDIKNVEFIGYINDVMNYLQEIDLIVCSSKREGLPINVIEGLSQGIPVIATNVRGHSDLIINGENGYLVDINSIEDFVSKIVLLLNDHLHYNSISAKAIKYSEKYESSNVLRELKRLYEIEME